MSLGQLRSCLCVLRPSRASLQHFKGAIPASFEGRRTLSTDPSVYKRAPWPYEKRGFNFLHCFYDFTSSRLCENSVIICVDGPPSCGKTELAKSIAQEFNLTYLRAPEEAELFDVNGLDLREVNPLFDNPKMRVYDMEMMFNEEDPSNAKLIHNTQMKFYQWKFRSFADALTHVLNTGQGVVVENSVWSDAVYAETLFKLGYTTRNAIRYYKEYRKNSIVELWKPQLVLHVEGPTSYILDQMKQKNPELANAPGLNEKFIDTLKDNYKKNYLPYMNTYSEVLSYDITDMPDLDLLTLDLERMDLANIQEDMPARFADWRKDKEEFWSIYRSYITTKSSVVKILNQGTPRNVPDETLSGEEKVEYDMICNTVPQLRYCRDVFYNKDGTKKDDASVQELLDDSPLAPANKYGEKRFTTHHRIV